MSTRRTFFFMLSITHYSRTIDGQYTHNKRTIPFTSSEDEDTIAAFTPYTLRPTLSLLLRLPSLIPCPIPPTDNRETTEGTPKEDHMTKKALFLRLSPKKVDLIPEKVVFIPKTVDYFPKTVDLSV